MTAKQETAPSYRQELALWDMSEIIVGKQLGRGGFCLVYEVQSFRLNPAVNSKLSASQVEARLAMAQKARKQQGNKSSAYAVKFLRTDMKDRKPKFFEIAKRDIQTEVQLLRSVSHDNIIEIRGCGIPGTDEYLLILDRLDGTLLDKLEQWKKQEKRLNHPVTKGLLDKQGLRKRRQQFLIERLQVATEIASALEYLHEKNLVYRDLKPSNIGFSSNSGQVKVIDMGLAKHLPGDKKDLDDCFEMSGGVGTYRFMAPEVALKRPYNQLSDVYSFAHVLYNVMCLKKPYEELSKSSHLDKVSRDGERPPIDPEWPTEIQVLLERAWSANMTERPSMKEVVTVLKQVTSMLIEGEISCNTPTISSVDSLEEHLNDRRTVITPPFCAPVYRYQMV